MPGLATPDWVERPLRIVDQIFESDTVTYQGDAAALRSAVEAAFMGRIKGENSDFRHLVPLINGLSKEQLTVIPSNSLVRFRCLVQDERPSSYHQDFLHVRQSNSSEIKSVCAMFKDGISLQADEEIVCFGERGGLTELRSLKCVPIPAESSWVQSLHSDELSNPSKKTIDPTLPTLVANFYADAGANIGINDAVEIFGILSFHDQGQQGSEESGQGDMALMGVPLDAVKLNALFYQPVIHSHPGLPMDKNAIMALSREEDFSFSDTRAALMEALTTSLGGDRLAAEYVLLHMISSVYARPDGQAIGNLPVNLSGLPQDVSFVKRLLLAMESFLSKVTSFSMNISALNAARLVPTMSEIPGSIDNELLPGLLQLTKHTHFILDEIGMDTGTLNDTGCKNLLALQKLVNEQKVDFNFLFGQNIPFLMDIPVLILSQGKSLVNCRCVVPLSRTDHSNHDTFSLSEEATWNIRQYLVTAKFLDYEIPNEMREAIVEKFVRSRKVDRSISPEDLHQQLEMARCMTISYGESVLTAERWEQVLKLEEGRNLRLK